MSTTTTTKTKTTIKIKILKGKHLTGMISEDNSCQNFGNMRVISGFFASISGKNFTNRVGTS
jgi:hypothetical protein